jgi:hypothetical protein
MSSGKWTVRALATMACCVASLGFAACGGGDDSTSSSTSSTAAETGASGESGATTAAQLEDAFRTGLAKKGITGADADCVMAELDKTVTPEEFVASLQQQEQTGDNTAEFQTALNDAANTCGVSVSP